MPKEWYDWKAASAIEDPGKKKLYRDIIAEKKPYFMRYIYPKLRNEYNAYLTNTNKSALREFGKTVDELMAQPYSDLTEQELEFLHWYENGIPVGTGDCVMNRICRIFEREFDRFATKSQGSSDFDYTIMKNGSEYTKTQYYKIKQIFESYLKRVKSYKVQCVYENIDSYDRAETLDVMRDEMMQSCLCVCSNEDILSDILLDVFYGKGSTHRFAMAICGDAVVRSLLAKNGNRISFPVQDPDGDIEYGGRKFRMETIVLEDED